MNIVLRIKELILDDQIDHLATDWEVSDTPNYSNIIFQSIEDRVNKLSIVWDDIEIDPNITYYARARALLSTGYAVWGNLEVFNIKNINDLNTAMQIPSKVATPLISTSSNHDNHDSTMFTITAAGFGVIGTSRHVSTTWSIEDMDNNVIWIKPNDDINKNSILVDDIILKSNRVFRIRAVFHSSTNDVSQQAAKTIHVNGGTEVNLIDYIDNMDVTLVNKLTLLSVSGISNVTWEILSNKDGVLQPTWSNNTLSLSVDIPSGTLQTGSSYLLRVKTNLTNSWKNIPFYTKQV